MHRLTKHEKDDRQRQDEIYQAAREDKQKEVDNYEQLQFFRKHPEYALFANQQLLLEWLETNRLAITDGNLEVALIEIGDSLAKQKRAAGYQRKTNTQRSMVTPQRPNIPAVHQPRPVVLPYSAAEIKAMKPDELKKLMKRPEYLSEINRVLAVKV